MTLPAEAPQLLHTNSFARHVQRMQDCEGRYIQLLNKPQDATSLFRKLQQSAQAREHVQQMLANFPPTTLERYLSCVDCFIFLHLAGGSCSPQVSSGTLENYLSASQGSLRQDRGLHRSKLCMWSELWDAMQSSIVRAYTRSTAIKDVRGSVPVPMALVVAWEKAVCDRAAFSQSVRLFLGTALLCTHGSIKFGDIQCAAWSSLQLSTKGLHGTCTATKTTRRGQPFAVTWHGISGRDTQSSWLLQWLAELAELTAPRSRCRQPETAPDFFSQLHPFIAAYLEHCPGQLRNHFTAPSPVGTEHCYHGHRSTGSLGVQRAYSAQHESPACWQLRRNWAWHGTASRRGTIETVLALLPATTLLILCGSSAAGHCNWPPVGGPTAAWQEGDKPLYQSRRSASHRTLQQSVFQVPLSSHQVLSVASWCHPFPASVLTPPSPRIVVSSAPLSSCHPSRLYPHCSFHGGILASSPRRRARAACKGSSRRAPRRASRRLVVVLVATSPRLRLVIAASSHRPRIPLSSPILFQEAV